jgi:hypothetical protein
VFNALAMKWFSVVFRGERVELCRNLGDDVWPALGLWESIMAGCTRLVRLLDELVNPRLEHLAELLVEGIAEGAAGAGGTGRLRGGVRAGVAGLGRRRGGRRIASAAGLSRCTAALARPLLLLGGGS